MMILHPKLPSMRSSLRPFDLIANHSLAKTGMHLRAPALVAFLFLYSNDSAPFAKPLLRSYLRYAPFCHVVTSPYQSVNMYLPMPACSFISADLHRPEQLPYISHSLSKKSLKLCRCLLIAFKQDPPEAKPARRLDIFPAVINKDTLLRLQIIRL